MDEHAEAGIVLFGGFRFDRRRSLLARQNEDGAFTPVAIGSRALDVLGLLIDRKGDLVSRDEILNTVWPGVVEGANVTVQISALRRALNDGGSEPSLVQTIPGRGYRFVASVAPYEPEPHASPVGAPGEEDDLCGEAAPAHITAVASAPPQSEALGRAERSNSGVQAAAGLRRRRAFALVAALAVALVLAVSGTAWWLRPTATPVSIPLATAITPPLVAPRLSIVVLPFVNLSNDPDQQFFADGITDDLTTDLSRIIDMFVIARNTASTYRNRLADAKQIGHELGVRYLLEGSVQRSGNQVRINAQLIDAETSGHLWAERFERDTNDLFAIQDEITSRIAIALNQELISAEAARHTERPDVLEYTLRARAAGAGPPSRDRSATVMSLYERALALDPHSVDAQSRLATELAGRVLSNFTDSPAAHIARANELIEQALAASPRSLIAHFARGQLLRAQRRYAEAIPEYETVLASNRNSVYTLFALGQCKLFTGAIEEAIHLIEQAIRLSPRDPMLGVWYHQIGVVHLLLGQTDQAVAWLEKARNHTPAHSLIRADLAASYALAGETRRAAVELAEARRLSPDDRYASLARLRATENWGVPKIRALREATYFAGLRKAGMPEK